MLPKCCQGLKNGLPDLPPMTPARYAQAKRRFTPAAVSEIRQALNPLADFDLEGRLWRAVSLYHYFSEPDLFQVLTPKQQAGKLAEVEGHAHALLGLLQNEYGILFDLTGDPRLMAELEVGLEHLLKHCRDRKPELPPVTGGRHTEHGQRHFFVEIAKTHLEVTGNAAPREFYHMCHEALIGAIGEENVNRLVKDINRKKN